MRRSRPSADLPTPNGTQAISPVAPSPPFRFPQAVHRCPSVDSGLGSGRIQIRLTPTHLYCADQGRPIDSSGVTALMFSHLSSKRGTIEIGRFGLGFKSVLGVTDTPEFFSRSGSFRFDRAKARELIRPVAPASERYPALRLPEPFDPWPSMESDPILRELMGWAVNIVRLPLSPNPPKG